MKSGRKEERETPGGLPPASLLDSAVALLAPRRNPRHTKEVWGSESSKQKKKRMTNKDKWRGTNYEKRSLQLTYPLPTFPRRSNYDLKSLDTYFIMWII